MSDPSTNRIARSIDRVWPLLSEAFEKTLALGESTETPALRDLLDRDLPTYSSRRRVGERVIENDLRRLTALASLDAADLESPSDVEQLTDGVRGLARDVRQALQAEIADTLIASPSTTDSDSDPAVITALAWPERVAEIRRALAGENGVLWLDQANFEALRLWTMDNGQDALPNVRRRRLAAFSPRAAGLLFPLSQRLITRTETIPVALSWDKYDQGRVQLHGWYRYQLAITPTAARMIRHWPPRPGRRVGARLAPGVMP